MLPTACPRKRLSDAKTSRRDLQRLQTAKVRLTRKLPVNSRGGDKGAPCSIMFVPLLVNTRNAKEGSKSSATATETEALSQAEWCSPKNRTVLSDRILFFLVSFWLRLFVDPQQLTGYYQDCLLFWLPGKAVCACRSSLCNMSQQVSLKSSSRMLSRLFGHHHTANFEPNSSKASRLEYKAASQ